MRKHEKVTLVETLADRMKNAKSMLFVDMTGLNVSQQINLRNVLKGVRANVTVAKNTLLGRAADKTMSDRSKAISIREKLTGPTAMVISEDDEIAALQKLGKFIREFELPKLKFGYISGTVYDEANLIKLSRLPSREVLQGQVVGAVAGPLYGLVETLQGNLQKLVYILDEYSKIRIYLPKGGESHG